MQAIHAATREWPINYSAQPCRSPLNIAEGHGKRSVADRNDFYDIARGSAHECGAVRDVSKALRLMDDKQFAQGKALLLRIVSMLVKMVQ